MPLHPRNQPPDLSDYDTYTSDPMLRTAVARLSGNDVALDAELTAQGRAYGAADTLQLGAQANRHPPELLTHDRRGERIDVVAFHPAWHHMMAMARRHGIPNRPYVDPRPGAWVAYGATLYQHSQIESGSTCPSVMTKAAIPLLRREPALDALLWPKLASTEHDPRDIPLGGKHSITVGMGMTERQGGSDLRSNETAAAPDGPSPWGEGWRLNGHKWFFSAPMCDAHLVLARDAEHGLGCFLVPRWRPDGQRNAVRINRLKDKVGNVSNASAEVEFHDAWGVRVGEPGRGIATLIEMATFTRLDCALSSAGLMRQALVQALHHARHRHAFGRALAEQPLMRALLADLALESQAATLLALELAGHFAADTPTDHAWRRLMTPAAKFWVCKRAVAVAAEAMEVWGGNGYVETGPMGRLFREAPVNAIWEGSGNVMCLDLLRGLARNPQDGERLLDDLASTASQDATLRARLGALAQALRGPVPPQEAQARRLTQQLVLLAQACLLLRHADAATAHAFIGSRFDPDWGAMPGAAAGVADPRPLLDAAWAG